MQADTAETVTAKPRELATALERLAEQQALVQALLRENQMLQKQHEEDDRAIEELRDAKTRLETDVAVVRKREVAERQDQAIRITALRRELEEAHVQLQRERLEWGQQLQEAQTALAESRQEQTRLSEEVAKLMGRLADMRAKQEQAQQAAAAAAGGSAPSSPPQPALPPPPIAPDSHSSAPVSPRDGGSSMGSSSVAGMGPPPTLAGRKRGVSVLDPRSTGPPGTKPLNLDTQKYEQRLVELTRAQLTRDKVNAEEKAEMSFQAARHWQQLYEHSMMVNEDIRVSEQAAHLRQSVASASRITHRPPRTRASCRVQTMQRDVEMVMERNSAFLLETSRLRAENDALEDTLARWQAQCKKLEGDLASLHASFEELGTIKDRAQQIDGRNAYLQRKLLEAVREAEVLRAELDHSRREFAVQNGLREHLQQQLDKLSEQLRGWEERHEKVAKQLGTAQSSNVQLAAAESEAKAMLGEIRRRLALREKELDASNAVRAKIQQELTDTVTELIHTQEKVYFLTQRVDAIFAQLNII